MGRRKLDRTIMKADWKKDKIVRDEKAIKRLKLGPTAGQKLAAKMAGRTI